MVLGIGALAMVLGGVMSRGRDAIDFSNELFGSLVAVTGDAHQAKVAQDIFRQEVRFERSLQIREDVRDVNKLMIESVQTHLFMGSIVFGVCFAMLIEGQPEAGTDRTIVALWLVFSSWAATFSLLGVWLALRFQAEISALARERLLRRHRFNVPDDAVVGRMGGHNIVNQVARFHNYFLFALERLVKGPVDEDAPVAPREAKMGGREFRLRTRVEAGEAGGHLDVEAMQKGLHAWRHKGGYGYAQHRVIDVPFFLVGETLVRSYWDIRDNKPLTLRVYGESTLYIAAQCPPLGVEKADVADASLAGFRKAIWLDGRVPMWPAEELPLVTSGYHEQWRGPSGFGEFKRVDGFSVFVDADCIEIPLYKLVLACPVTKDEPVEVVVSFNFTIGCEALILMLRRGQIHCKEEDWPIAEFNDEIKRVLPLRDFSGLYTRYGIICLMTSAVFMISGRMWLMRKSMGIYWFEIILVSVIVLPAILKVAFVPIDVKTIQNALSMPSINRIHSKHADDLEMGGSQRGVSQPSSAGPKWSLREDRVGPGFSTGPPAPVFAPAPNQGILPSLPLELPAQAPADNSLAILDDRRNAESGWDAGETSTRGGMFLPAGDAGSSPVPPALHLNAEARLFGLGWCAEVQQCRGVSVAAHGLEPAKPGVETTSNLSSARRQLSPPVYEDDDTMSLDGALHGHAITSDEAQGADPHKTFANPSDAMDTVKRENSVAMDTVSESGLPHNTGSGAHSEFTRVTKNFIFWTSVLKGLCVSSVAGAMFSGFVFDNNAESDLEPQFVPALVWTPWVVVWPPFFQPTALLMDEGASLLHVAAGAVHWAFARVDGAANLRFVSQPTVFPEPARALALYEGRLAVVGDSGVHFASLPSVAGNGLSSPGGWPSRNLTAEHTSMVLRLPSSVPPLAAAALQGHSFESGSFHAGIVSVSRDSDGCPYLCRVLTANPIPDEPPTCEIVARIEPTGRLLRNVTGLHVCAVGHCVRAEAVLWVATGTTLVALGLVSGEDLGIFRLPTGAPHAVVLLSGNSTHLFALIAARGRSPELSSTPYPVLRDISTELEL